MQPEENRSSVVIWRQRWDAINETVNDMAKSYGNSSVAVKKDIFCPLLTSFQQFAAQHFDFFVSRSENGDLDRSDDYPFNYALRATLDQIEFDLEVIRRAADQRIAYPDVSDTLEKADKLVYLALRPAVQGGLLDGPPAAITYFGKSPSIRVIPYATAALVGIPFTCGSTDQDYLAIPHEVGHYVFWNGRSGPTKRLIHETLCEAAKDFKYCRWLEEIWADVYGGLVGGPALALDFQELQVENSQNGFVSDDGKHPIPSERPQVHLRLFERLGLSKARAMLEDGWQAKLVSLSQPQSARVTANAAEVPDLISLVDAVIDKTFEFLPKQLFQSNAWWDWPDDPAVDVDTSFQPSKLIRRVTKKELSAAPEPVSWADWAGEFFNDGKGPVPETGEVKVTEWRELLKARGWATKGPQTDPSHG